MLEIDIKQKKKSVTVVMDVTYAYCSNHFAVKIYI